MNTKNYRGIALLNTCYIIFLIAVLHRLEKYTNDVIVNYQTEFIRGKSTTDHIFTVRLSKGIKKILQIRKGNSHIFCRLQTSI